MDLLTLVGVVLGGAAIVFGFALEGGHFSMLFQFEALVIVLGGTLGAVMIQNTWARFFDAVKQLRLAFVRARGRGLELLANGVSTAVLEDALQRELDAYERSRLAAVRVWQQAGGYAPTFGILGSVLGLVQVTSHILEPAQLGPGIAVAFIATLYARVREPRVPAAVRQAARADRQRDAVPQAVSRRLARDFAQGVAAYDRDAIDW